MLSSSPSVSQQKRTFSQNPKYVCIAYDHKCFWIYFRWCPLRHPQINYLKTCSKVGGLWREPCHQLVQRLSTSLAHILFCASFQVCDFWDIKVLHASFAVVTLSPERNKSLAENFVLSSTDPKSGSAVSKSFQIETCSIIAVTCFSLMSDLNNHTAF